MEMAKGVRYLHTRKPPIIHRDLKAENILLTDFLACKVADFGVSTRHADAEREMTQTGSPAWLAPEVIGNANNPHHYDQKIDVWSYGLILWELETHETPYTDEENINSYSIFEMMNKIVQQELTPS